MTSTVSLWHPLCLCDLYCHELDACVHCARLCQGPSPSRSLAFGHVGVPEVSRWAGASRTNWYCKLTIDIVFEQIQFKTTWPFFLDMIPGAAMGGSDVPEYPDLQLWYPHTRGPDRSSFGFVMLSRKQRNCIQCLQELHSWFFCIKRRSFTIKRRSQVQPCIDIANFQFDKL